MNFTFTATNLPKISRVVFVFIVCLTVPLFIIAQKQNENYKLHIRKSTVPIVIDGIAGEQAWQDADRASDFFMVLPMDTSRAKVRTEVSVTYDDHHFYILARCYLPAERKYMVESLRRDFAFGKNDNFIFFIDPFDDRTNGFTFGANAAGAQWDGMLYSGGSADLAWDNKWKSVVKTYDDQYIFEAAIPFKSIRYKKGISQWGINFSRLDINVAEKSSWTPIPRQFPTASLAYTGTLVWDQPPPDPGLNVSLIPYVLTGFSKDVEHHGDVKYRREIGGDAKVAITSSLNLDLTLNPDFSQVEVDRQVTNLDRYELFFPERRQFFLENNDLFANFGYATIRPFFSRRIGLGVPIRYGARLSGSLNRNWRIGAMDMQTKSIGETGLPAQNFAVLALQRRVFSRSNIRLMMVNKQSINYLPGKDSTLPRYSDYNRNIGIEYNLASSNNVWTGKALFIKSFTPGRSGKDFVHAAHLQYFSRKWTLIWQHEMIGEHYNAEVGYVPRKNYIRIFPQLNYLFFPKRGAILSHGPVLSSSFFFNHSLVQTDNENIVLYKLNFRNQAVFDAWVANDYIRLLQPFDPTNSGKDSIATGTRHDWKAYGTDFFSKPQALFTYSFSTRFGGYYLSGKRSSVSGELGYRFQPYVNLSLTMNYNHIELPEPWKNTDFWLLGPRVDITFSNKIYFTTFFQYNNQLDNINLNTRFQWRYKPASDLFIVYTDNYFPAPFGIRNRALVLKLTYWWNP